MDKSLYNIQQPQGISETLQNYIDSMVEEIVLEGKPFDTQKKYLKKFSENEGLDYDKLEADIVTFIEIIENLKESPNKLMEKFAEEKGRSCHISEIVISELLNNSKQQTLPEMVFEVKGIPFKMVRVEGGSFQMGATAEQKKDAKADEKPVHEVTLSSYYIGETVVTQELWAALMEDNSYRNPEKKAQEWVSWYDCQEFINKLNSITGKSFRLPTEAEWEFAARGGNHSKAYKYAGSNNFEEVGWGFGYERHFVAQLKANELGLFDMSGNVDEWCDDWYDENYYSNSPKLNPKGAEKGSERVKRGFGTRMSDYRVSARHHTAPDVSYEHIGFRLALDTNTHLLTKRTEEKVKCDSDKETSFVENMPWTDPTRRSGIYTGSIMGEIPNGKGCVRYDDGLCCEGDFVNGRLNGIGKVIKRKGDDAVEIYEGEFKDGKLNGKGKETMSYGTIYEGEFKHGKLYGKGRIIDKDGSLQAEGEFAGNCLNGKGKQKKYSYGYCFEEGDFVYGELNGQGKRTRENGKIEIGEFKNGDLFNGIIIDANTKYIVTNGKKEKQRGIC